MRLALLFVLTLLVINSPAQQPRNPYTDSIYTIFESMPDDTHKVRYIIETYEEYLWMYDEAESYDHLKTAMRLAKRFQADTLEYLAYKSMAHYCERIASFEYVLYNAQAALRKAEELGDSVKMAVCWIQLAKAYSGLGQNELAISYYFQSLPYIEAGGDIERVGRVHTFIGWAYGGMGKIDSAIYFLELGRKERAQGNYPEGVLATNGSLFNFYLQEKRYEEARGVMAECMLINDTLWHNDVRASFSSWQAQLHEQTGNLDSALWYRMYGIDYARRTNSWPGAIAHYKDVALLLARLNRKDEAYQYFKAYVDHNDSVQAWQKKIHMDQAREIYDVEYKNQQLEEQEQRISAQEQEATEKDRQRMWLLIILGITAIAVVLALLAYRNKQRSAAMLAKQKDIIEEKNRDITDSIVYAQRIQKAILPSLKQIEAALPESFVFFRPKDIVSGDFFWFNETPWSYYIAAVDCTGHGVPGAMMSMIGYNFLGQIVNEQDVEQPAEILNELHRKVLLALNKDLSSREIKDGMDVALLRIDKKTGKIYFSGAVRPLYIIVDGEMTVVKGDIFSVGGVKDATSESFTQHEIEAPAGATLYIFSDGIADQFGGPKGKKYKYKQLKDLLLENSGKSMSEQLAAIETSFDSWKGNLEQVDDVCVVGLRVTA